VADKPFPVFKVIAEGHPEGRVTIHASIELQRDRSTKPGQQREASLYALFSAIAAAFAQVVEEVEAAEEVGEPGGEPGGETGVSN
jgi:hypothetical protein